MSTRFSQSTAFGPKVWEILIGMACCSSHHPGRSFASAAGDDRGSPADAIRRTAVNT